MILSVEGLQPIMDLVACWAGTVGPMNVAKTMLTCLLAYIISFKLGAGRSSPCGVYSVDSSVEVDK